MATFSGQMFCYSQNPVLCSVLTKLLLSQQNFDIMKCRLYTVFAIIYITISEFKYKVIANRLSGTLIPRFYFLTFIIFWSNLFVSKPQTTNVISLFILSLCLLYVYSSLHL